MLNDSAKKLNAQILRNLRQEKEYAVACKNYERLEVLEMAIKQHELAILAEYEKDE